MKVLVLGAGNFSSVKHHNVAFLVSSTEPCNNLGLETPDAEQKRLMFDCGRDIKFSLHDAGLKPQQITDIFISHQHGDHMAGLDYLLTMAYFTPKTPRPKLYFHKSMLGVITKTVEVYMETFEDEKLPKDANGRPRRVLLTDVCEPHVLEDNAVFWVGNIEYSLVQSMHVVTGGMFMPSFGLIAREVSRKENRSKRLFITGDTQFCPSQLLGNIESCDATITDCETSPVQFKSGVHAHMEDWKTLIESIRKKLFMTHYGDNVDDKFIEENKSFFRGFLRKGETIEL